MNNAGVPDDVSAIALAKEEASRVSNDGRSRGNAGRGTPVAAGTADSRRDAGSAGNATGSKRGPKGLGFLAQASAWVALQ